MGYVACYFTVLQLLPFILHIKKLYGEDLVLHSYLFLQYLTIYCSDRLQILCLLCGEDVFYAVYERDSCENGFWSKQKN